VRDAVRGSDRVGAVEHASEEDKAIACVACLITPGGPNEGGRGIGCVVAVRHDGANEDSYEDAGEDEKETFGMLV